MLVCLFFSLCQLHPISVISFSFVSLSLTCLYVHIRVRAEVAYVHLLVVSLVLAIVNELGIYIICSCHVECSVASEGLATG